MKWSVYHARWLADHYARQEAARRAAEAMRDYGEELPRLGSPLRRALASLLGRLRKPRP